MNALVLIPSKDGKTYTLVELIVDETTVDFVKGLDSCQSYIEGLSANKVTAAIYNLFREDTGINGMKKAIGDEADYNM